MAAVHVYTVSQLIHIPHLLVMILSEAYQVNASLIPTIEAAWQVPQVQTTYRCNMMAIATSHSSSESYFTTATQWYTYGRGRNFPVLGSPHIF